MVVVVVAAVQMSLQPVSAPILPVLQCPLGLAKLQVCPYPDVVYLPTSSFVRLLFTPVSLCLCELVLARLDEWEIWPYHCSLSPFTIGKETVVWSN